MDRATPTIHIAPDAPLTIPATFGTIGLALWLVFGGGLPVGPVWPAEAIDYLLAAVAVGAVATFVHEVGHAVAGWALGMNIVGVHVALDSMGVTVEAPDGRHGPQSPPGGQTGDPTGSGGAT